MQSGLSPAATEVLASEQPLTSVTSDSSLQKGDGNNTHTYLSGSLCITHMGKHLPQRVLSERSTTLSYHYTENLQQQNRLPTWHNILTASH